MGGGVKNKVLEAMACGLPVVGTPEAFASIPVASGIQAVICPLDRIAAEVAALLQDPTRRGPSAGWLVTGWSTTRTGWPPQSAVRPYGAHP